MRRVLTTVVFSGAAATAFLLYGWPLPKAEGPPYQGLPILPYFHHPNRHVISQVPRRIGIIGAGPSGLITAKVLKQQGYSVEVLEKRDNFGGVWYKNYDDAGLQIPYFCYEIPDHQFPFGTSMIPKQEELLKYFKGFVERFELAPHLHFNSEVRSVRQLENETWEVAMADGTKKTYDFLTVCNGPFHLPNMPTFPGAEKFTGRILHSSQFLNAKELCEGKKVVVIGGGKSALDILNVASNFAHSTTGLMRTINWAVPLGYTYYGIHADKLLFSRLADLLAAPAYCESGQVNRLLRSVGKVYWDYIGKLMSEDLPESARPTLSFEEGRDRQLMTREIEYTEKVQKGTILIKRGEVTEITPNGVVTHDGQQLDADVIVLATGFQRRYFGLQDEWTYRGILQPGVRNYAVIGLMSSYATPTIVSLQAMWLAEMLRGELSVPSIEKMKSDIEARKAHMQQRVNTSKAPLLLPDNVYADMLVRDMGLSTRRQSRYLDYWLSTVTGPPYQTVLTHRV